MSGGPQKIAAQLGRKLCYGGKCKSIVKNIGYAVPTTASGSYGDESLTSTLNIAPQQNPWYQAAPRPEERRCRPINFAPSWQGLLPFPLASQIFSSQVAPQAQSAQAPAPAPQTQAAPTQNFIRQSKSRERIGPWGWGPTSDLSTESSKAYFLKIVNSDACGL